MKEREKYLAKYLNPALSVYRSIIIINNRLKIIITVINQQT